MHHQSKTCLKAWREYSRRIYDHQWAMMGTDTKILQWSAMMCDSRSIFWERCLNWTWPRIDLRELWMAYTFPALPQYTFTSFKKIQKVSVSWSQGSSMRLETVLMASVMKVVNCSMAWSLLFSSKLMRCCSNLGTTSIIWIKIQQAFSFGRIAWHSLAGCCGLMSDSCWFTNGLSCSPNTRLAPHQGRVDHLLQPLSQVSAQAKGKTLQCASPWFISPISIVMRILQ